jgi:hypothetical protein
MAEEKKDVVSYIKSLAHPVVKYVKEKVTLPTFPTEDLNHLFQYFRLQNRPQIGKLCSDRFIPSDTILKTVFDLDEDLTREQRERLIRKYRKNCKQLANRYLDIIYLKRINNELTQMFGGKKHFLKVIWNGDDSLFKLQAEMFINLAIKTYETAMLSWSEWLITTSEGQMLMDMIQNGDSLSRKSGLAILFTYLYTIYITSGYDDLYFQKEMTKMLPHIKDYIPNPILGWLLAKGIAIYGTSTFLSLYKNYLQKEIDIPDNFFKNWYHQ